MAVPTPHITAKEGDFAKTVLMPGDPLRAKYIAENYLENAVLVNNVRGVGEELYKRDSRIINENVNATHCSQSVRHCRFHFVRI